MRASPIAVAPLAITVTSVTGQESYRWDTIAERVKWSTLINGGFGTLQLTLRRTTRVAGMDLQFLNDIKVHDEGGNLLFEGRIEDIAPYSSGDDSGYVIEAVGYKTLLDDKPYHEAPVRRQIPWALRPLSDVPSARPDLMPISIGQLQTTDPTKIGFAVTQATATAGALIQVQVLDWLALSSCTGIYYDVSWSGCGGGGGAMQFVLYSWTPGGGYVLRDTVNTVNDNGTSANLSKTFPASNGVLFSLSSLGGTPAAAVLNFYNISLNKAYCPLTNLQAGSTASNVDAKTITALDAICELLSYSYQLSYDPTQIQTTSGAAFTMPDFDYFNVPTTQSDVLNNIMAFLPSWWGVYDNKQLWVRDFDATRTDWVVRLANGVQMDLQPTSSEAFSSAIVKYTTPAGQPTWYFVNDSTPDSIFQRVYGSPQRAKIFDSGITTTQAVIAALGPVFFPENSYEIQRGTITIPAQSLCQGPGGSFRPAYRMRAGDNIRVSDAPSSRALYGNAYDRQSNFIVRAVDVDWDAQTVTASVDNSMSSITQLFARLAAINQAQFGQ